MTLSLRPTIWGLGKLGDELTGGSCGSVGGGVTELGGEADAVCGV